ncbi:MAG: fused MFS/spermidine synthase [Sedimentisphaerales bacterium]|nr:fused MFS/spermidine synthase [Sedimentisphaerales bacterium]
MDKLVLKLCFCAAIVWQATTAGTAAGARWGRLVHKRDSLYQVIYVYKQGTVVTLRFGKQPAEQLQSQVDVSNLRQHRLEYTKIAFCGMLYKPAPRRILVLGLGGGVIPREMHHYFPTTLIDVVEIDPEIPKIAREFFCFAEDDRLKVHIADGRMFIRERIRRKVEDKYDIVILDAFNSEYIPFHLTTKEFLEEVKEVLADDGVVVANVFYNNRLFEAQCATFLAVFGRCQVFFGSYTNNAMLVSPGQKCQTLTIREAMKQANILQHKANPAFDMLAVSKQFRPSIRPAPSVKVLTDDRAPVNRLQKQKRRRTEQQDNETAGKRKEADLTVDNTPSPY